MDSRLHGNDGFLFVTVIYFRYACAEAAGRFFSTKP
jgi:hypothetical protein